MYLSRFGQQLFVGMTLCRRYRYMFSSNNDSSNSSLGRDFPRCYFLRWSGIFPMQPAYTCRVYVEHWNTLLTQVRGFAQVHAHPTAGALLSDVHRVRGVFRSFFSPLVAEPERMVKRAPNGGECAELFWPNRSVMQRIWCPMTRRGRTVEEEPEPNSVGLVLGLTLRVRNTPAESCD